MSRLSLTIFDKQAEILSFEYDSSSVLEIEIKGTEDGYVRLGDKTEKIINGKCVFNTKDFLNEEYLPILINSKKEISLVKLMNKGGILTPFPADENYIRHLSLRAYRLEERLSSLELEIKQLRDKIFGTTIF